MTNTSNTDEKIMPLYLRLIIMAFLAILFAGLAYAILSIPLQSPGLSAYTIANIDISGVTNPVTAVLLNYRAYDTFLELGVLLLAVLGIWSLGRPPEEEETISKTSVQAGITNLLAPILILVSGYILWAGASYPGGAFQAGALLGAAGVLLFLAGWKLNPRFTGVALRLALSAGFVIFAAVGAAFIFLGNEFLEYPIAYAGILILIIEVAATISIGISLAAMFLGFDPEMENNK